MASGPITSWQIDGETMETVTDFIFLGFKITADGDCSHEIKRHLPLGRKDMTNLDSVLKSRDITLPTKLYLVKAVVFLVVVYGCESCTIKKAEHQRIDAFQLWCWRLLRVPWTARRSNQSILKEINHENSLEGLILKLKLHYLGHLMQRADSSGDLNGKWREVTQLCPTLCNSMDCSLPGSSIHGILQGRILEWVAISFSRGSSQPKDWTWVSRIGGRRFNLWATREAQGSLNKRSNMCKYSWFTLLYSWNKHNTVEQLYSNKN